MPKLSICIPTYNRSKLLAELLDSILIQDCDALEVVISDDASPDNTAEVATSFAKRFKHFRFVRQPQNLGIDRNFLAAAAMGTGEYVWLMGDDDYVEPGGVQRVLNALAEWPAVSGLTLGVVDYDATLTRPTGLRNTPPTHLIADVHGLFEEIPELLGFVSALVVHRQRWLAAAADPTVIQFYNYYVQVYILGRVAAAHGGWGVVQEPCVRYRSSNDQFLTALGWYRRLEVDVKAYEQLANALFADAPKTRARMLRRIFDSHILARVINGKRHNLSTPLETAKALATLVRHYPSVPTLWSRAIPLLLAPPQAVRALSKFYRRVYKGSGAARAQAFAGGATS
jgi:glycosyltransferase involved in cell wall biosynthesis